MTEALNREKLTQLKYLHVLFVAVVVLNTAVTIFAHLWPFCFDCTVYARSSYKRDLHLRPRD